LYEESVIPLVDDIGDIALVDDPSVVGERSGDLDGDFVVVPVRTGALAVVVEDAVARTDADGVVLADP